MHIHGMFVFGFDSDTIESCKTTVRFAIKHKIDSVQFLILTPLPGTKFYSQMVEENRITDRDWKEYDAHHVKFEPKNMTLSELQSMQIRGHCRFYSWWNNIFRLIRGKMASFIIGVYAHFLNIKMKRVEKRYLRRIRTYEYTYEENTTWDGWPIITN